MWELIGRVAVAFVLVKVGWSIVKGLYGSFLAAALGLNIDVKKMGKWAVVTGATDGIGKAFAFHLARRGINIVLVSRTPYKLQNVAAELSSKYNVETKIIDVDFTSTSIYERITKELEGLEIGILINNVGMSYDYPEYLTDIPDGNAMCQRLINCNILSLTMMSRIVLPGMVERRKGLIINLASLSATIPAPFLAIYAATKSYVESLSESMAIEYKSKGITVQCILPGFVVSNMSKIKRPSLMAPTPTAYVSSTLRTTGVEKRTGGYALHKLQMIWDCKVL
ncbi:hydroxysteroid 17-beta dehydrogenase 12 spidey isoform X2 [Oratosquilla oratoria]|uniref:hydroxysteroid 17-beta dehydrogenase 12 spidey isoform X2 n=1 Tax=Oratosquilla oratoria TaxID=337810 RepID=UPI003F7714B2